MGKIGWSLQQFDKVNWEALERHLKAVTPGKRTKLQEKEQYSRPRGANCMPALPCVHASRSALFKKRICIQNAEFAAPVNPSFLICSDFYFHVAGGEFRT